MTTDLWDQFPSGKYGPPVPYTFTVLNARFITDPTDTNNPDTPKLFLSGRTDDEDWQDFEMTLRVERDRWEIVDGGAEIRATRRTKLPSVKTQYGKFARSINTNAASDNELKRLHDILLQRGTPLQAHVWKGLRLVIGEQTESFINDAGERQEFYPNVIVDFAGTVDDDEMASMDADREKAQEELVKELTQLAKDSDSQSEFANAAVSDFDIRDLELQTDVMNPGKNGFYARVNK